MKILLNFSVATATFFVAPAFAADAPPALQLPGAYQQQILKQLKDAGENGKDLPKPANAPAPRPGVAFAPAVPATSHYTYCAIPQFGFLNSVVSEGSFTKDAVFKVTVKKQGAQEEIVEVEDAKVSLRKWSLFDEATHANWGLGGQSKTVVKTYAVKMFLKSERHFLGMVVQGCIPQNVKEVEILTMCYDSTTTWGR